MVYEYKGKRITINDNELEKNMRLLGLSKEEAIQMWLEDEGYEDNEEQVALTKKAKDNKITATIHGASGNKKTEKKTQKERVKKENPTKKGLISDLSEFLEDIGAKDVQIVNETKLITFKFDEKLFKLDLIETRVKKQ